MHRMPLLLGMLALATPVRAQEDEASEQVRDKKSGLVVRMPEQWSRETAREKGSVKFAGLYDLSSTKYVLFTVETGPSPGFDETAWLATEKTAVAKFLKSTDTSWTTEPVMIGGTRAIRYTVGGKANGEKESDLRIRACGLVKNNVFFKISERSYNRAHEESAEALTAMWEAVKFEEANPFGEEEKEEGAGEEETSEGKGGAGEGGAEEGSSDTPKGEPLVIEDKAGNFKVTALPGWSMLRTPPDDTDSEIRLVLVRSEATGDLVQMEFYRYREDDADVFVTEEPGDYLIKRLVEKGWLESHFEQGSAKSIRPEIDARARLGAADKSCGFEARGLPLSEEAKIDEAKKLIARGDTSVTVPEFKPIVIRGRIGMISPYVYVVRTVFAREEGDNEKLIAECNQILDTLEFSSTEGKPPPLGVGEQALGNTLADPANQAERKKSKVHEYKKGVKVAAALKIDYVLPPGFQEVERVEDRDAQKVYGGADMPIIVAAQDENNGWVFITVIAASSKRLGSNEKFTDKKEIFDGWVHNFESLARGAKRIPKKAVDIKIGNLSGDGCELEGKINNFSATETHLVTDEAGWRIEIEIKTRGTGARTFAKQLDTFRKKFKATKK